VRAYVVAMAVFMTMLIGVTRELRVLPAWNCHRQPESCG